MRERATLRLDSGDEVRVEVDRADLDHEEIVVRRASGSWPPFRLPGGRVGDLPRRTGV
jgi:hypothetical protein